MPVVLVGFINNLSGFNGGKSQGQSQSAGLSGDWPYLNLAKQGGSWIGSDSFNSGATINPSWLAADGYPLASALAGTGGANVFVSLPAQSSFTGNVKVLWDVTGAGPSDQIVMLIGTMATTFVATNVTQGGGSSFSCTGNATDNFYTFQPLYTNPSFSFSIVSMGGTAHLSNLRVVLDAVNPGETLTNAQLLAQGKIFNPQFLKVLRQGGFGLYRFKDIFDLDVPSCNTTTWATRKSMSYVTWADFEWRASLYVGLTTISGAATVNAALSSLTWAANVVTATTSSPHGVSVGKTFGVTIRGVTPSGYNIDSGVATSTGASTFTYPLGSNPGTETVPGTYSANCSDYNLSIPGGYAWTGPNGTYSGGGAPVANQTMHLRFDADAVRVNGAQNDGTVTISGIPGTVTFGWTAHPFSNGDPVTINTAESGGTQMLGTAPGINYYVVNAAANTFQVATTPGGTAITSSNAGGGNLNISRLPTLNINSTGALPLRTMSGDPFPDTNFIPRSTFSGSAVQIYGTVIFDADLQSWLLAGGAYAGGGSAGLDSGAPPEVCLELCKEIGFHPHWSIPHQTLDPATDYVTSLATLCKTTGPSWMIPHFEPSNEVWNTIFTSTHLAMNKGFAHWPSVENYGLNFNNWYGKVLSVMGQGLASVYGLGNRGSTYEAMCGVWTGGKTISNDDERLNATAYFSQSAAAQSGYIKDHAYPYTTCVLPAVYITGTMYLTVPELFNAGQYFITNVGNATAQAANLNTYADSLGGIAAPFNLAWTQGLYSSWKSWAAGFGVNKMRSYEGGYSPDLIGSDVLTGTFVVALNAQWQSPITAASNAASSVLALATTFGITTAQGGQTGALSGNPAVNGMVLSVQGVGGATGLNCISGGVTLTAGSPNITWPGNILVVDQCVQFRVQVFPPWASAGININPAQTYFVVSSGNPFQISATKGGSPITVTITGGGTFSATADSGWSVTNVSGNNVTINAVNAPGVWTSGGTAYYLNSTTMVNNFRVATLLFATDLGPAGSNLTKANYDNYTALGGLFPSQYELSGVNNIWACVQPDIWGTQSTEFAAIVAYNH